MDDKLLDKIHKNTFRQRLERKTKNSNRLINRIDYIELYSEQLALDNSGFKQHKKIINSQIRASKELFKNKFGKQYKKKNARKYLKEIELI